MKRNGKNLYDGMEKKITFHPLPPKLGGTKLRVVGFSVLAAFC
jgi:hypothetical protein